LNLVIALYMKLASIARQAISGLLLLSCLGGAASAVQSSKKNGGAKGFEVRLPVTVLEKRKVISGLARDDFQVFENGRRQKIRSFTVGKENPPAFVGLLMDTSPATSNKLLFIKEAALNFLYTATLPRKDKAAFMTFDNTITLRTDFTDKIDILDRAINKVKEPGLKAALYDAVWNFADEKLR
jgi:VWFA-related protein